MHEILLVIASMVGFVVIGLLAKVITPEIVFEFGLWILAGGILIGIPAGFWYHVLLFRALKKRMTLPAGWWRSPVALHDRLTPSEFRPVRPWFVAGAVGFVLCCLGGVAAIAGLSVGQFYP